jgi:hypothetical protein
MPMDERPAKPEENTPTYQYDLFISYRRKDGRLFADWLRRQLLGFRLPDALAQLRDRPLRIYQDTAYERATEDFWQHSIEPALRA